MIYVTSDLHGCPPAVLQKLLASAGFSEQDFLYILGDAADRGACGAELFLWLTQQPNVELILGNHEAFLLACDFLFEEVTEERLESLSAEKLELVNEWILNGGSPTMKGFQHLRRQDPELVEGILDYLRDCPLYDCLQVGKRKFVLVHAGLENFRPDRPLSDYQADELIHGRPKAETRYYGDPDIMVIFGHTPTSAFDEAYGGKAYHGADWICIDTGAAMGGTPMLLRLDDMKEFYA